MVPLNQGVLALRHKLLHLGKDAGRHLSNRKLQPIVLRPGKLADATPVREDLFKTSAHVSPTLFVHRSGAEAQQSPHLLGNHLLFAVWNALDRLFETLEARMATRMPAP